MSARFECPKCQFVFLARRAPESDCPACGSAAHPAGEATIRRESTSGEEFFAQSADFAPAHTTGSNIFGGLVDDESANVHSFSPSDTQTNAPLQKARVFSGEGDPFSKSELESFDPFGAVPDSGFELGRTETQVQTVNTRLDDRPPQSDPFAPRETIVVDPTLASEPQASFESSLFAEAEDVSSSAPILDVSQLPIAPTSLPGLEPAPSPFSEATKRDQPLTSNTHIGSDLSSIEPLVPQRPKARPAMQAASQSVFEEGTLVDQSQEQNDSSMLSEEFSPSAEGDPFRSGELKPGAVLLSAIEAQMQGAQPLADLSDIRPEASIDGFSAAFDDEPNARDALLAASHDLGMSSAALPLRAEDVATSIPAPPSHGAPKRVSPTLEHLSLSQDTLQLCGLPMPSKTQVTYAQNVGTNLAQDITRADKSSEGLALPPLEASEASTPAFAEVGAEFDRNRDPALEVDVPVLESTFAGFTPLRLTLLVLGCFVLGTVLGAIIAPSKKVDKSPRGQARAMLATGNRALADGRTDDALEQYRSAIIKDKDFVSAYRAKAIALAKIKGREDEAVAAYEKYISLAPKAADANEIKEIIVRYKGKSSE